MKLSREEILRMVGLTSRGLGSRLNEIEEGLEGAGDTLEKYWTQIVKNEKEITLIAGREAQNETDIAQLQVTAREISAQVTSVSSDVETNKRDIASLNIKANSIDLRVDSIEDDYVTSATLSLYVTKNSVSWLTGSADNVIFNFSNVFQIQHNDTAVLSLDANGNLKITGQLKQNSTIGTVLPIKVDDSGNILRQTVDGTWIANYAGRFVKYKNFVRNNDTFEMRPGDDLLLSNGNYDPKNVYLPLNPANGKVISIKNIGGKTVIRPARNSTQAIRMTDEAIDHFDLNTYDRIELVFYDGTWWGNVSPI